MGTPSALRAVRYGPSLHQEADLYLPPAPRPPVLCLLHGGFWRMPYGREQMDSIAEDLVSRGFAVWNLGYRRLGTQGAGWPATLEDAAARIEYLARLSDDGIDLELDRVTVVGHSAGGHLALWAAGRNRSPAGPAARIRIIAAFGLAPITDLALAHAMGLGGDAVAELLGGTPDRYPERCVAASPIELLTLRVPQVILHGTADGVVPIELSRRYARAAAAAGDVVELLELPGTGHMAFLDPLGEAHAALQRRLSAP